MYSIFEMIKKLLTYYKEISSRQLKSNLNIYFRSLFNGSLDITDHERDYATLDRANRGPIGPVIPGITSTPMAQGSLARQNRLDISGDSGMANFYGGSLGPDEGGEPQIVGNLS